MFTKVRAFTGEQFGQDFVGVFVDHLGKSVDGRNGSDLVATVEGGSQNSDGAQAGVAAGNESQVIRCPHDVDNPDSGLSGVQGGFNTH